MLTEEGEDPLWESPTTCVGIRFRERVLCECVRRLGDQSVGQVSGESCEISVCSPRVFVLLRHFHRQSSH
uniref:Uncharacterized protein n=1 Tax=Physcomitrium patens TaxID=3218 RepID=A0A7I4ESI1_PHYPA